LGPMAWLWDCDGNRIAPLANPPAGTVAAAYTFSPESRFVRLRATVGDTATALRLFDATGGEAPGPGVPVTSPAARPPGGGGPACGRYRPASRRRRCSTGPGSPGSGASWRGR